jgi:Caspase domain
MKRTLFAFLFCALNLSAQISGQQTPSKEALLIANGDYAHFGKLPNPVSDARLLAQSLQRVGFRVALLENQSREGMLDALNAFQDRLKASHGLALFHYGGHGVQVNGRNFLIPVDADIPDERKVSTRAVDLEEVMSSLDASGSAVNVVVLDACRDNPLPATSSRSASRGLSVVQTKPKNSLIVYAAEPGSKAEDGLFTPTLAEVIASPGKSLSQIFKDVRRQVFQKSNGNQTPGEYDQLFEDVYLSGGANTSPPPPPQEIAQPTPLPQPSIQPMMAAVPRSPQAGYSVSVDRPNLGSQFVNSLGQRFVPIPGTPTYFCIWDTRVSDYGKFVQETGRFWKPAGFPQKADHAALRISWEDATAFCEWLTAKEHASWQTAFESGVSAPKGSGMECGGWNYRRDGRTAGLA